MSESMPRKGRYARYIPSNLFQDYLAGKQLAIPYETQMLDKKTQFVEPSVVAVVRRNLWKLEDFGQSGYTSPYALPPELQSLHEQADQTHLVSATALTSKNMFPQHFEHGRLLLKTVAYLTRAIGTGYDDSITKIGKTGYVSSLLERPEAPLWSTHFLLHFSRVCFPQLFADDISITAEEVMLSQILYLYFKMTLFQSLRLKTDYLTEFHLDYCLKILDEEYVPFQLYAIQAVKAFAQERNVANTRMAVLMQNVWNELHGNTK